MRTASITLRLTLFFAAISTAVLLAVGYVIVNAVQAHFLGLDMVELNGKLELVRHVLAKATSQHDLDAIPQALDDSLVGHPGLSIVVLGSDGRVFFASSDAVFSSAMLDSTHRQAHAEVSIRELDGHAFREIVASARTGIAGTIPFTVVVTINIDHQRVFLKSMRDEVWLAIVAGVLLTILLGWIAARRGLAPVRHMAALAHRISATQLNDRLAPANFPAELRGLAEAFNDMLGRLEESFRRLSEFSSDLAHEMRTPVSNLVTQTEVALSRARSDDEYRDVLHSSLEEYGRLARMISDMLFLAKADNEMIVPRAETVELAAETRQLLDFYGALAEEKRVCLTLTGECSIQGEALMIRRAISNLISNAIRHTPAGGTVGVTIAVDSSGTARLAVENFGEPIPVEHLPRLFDRFYRVDPSRKASSDGVGLGLAITKSIVKAHGGEMTVTSSGRITRFVATFHNHRIKQKVEGPATSFK